jgi:3',5'-nucleoside bisphosphate phosphatase
MLRLFQADLHVHTVLSACAEVEMIPPLIIRQARQLGLSLIAITDHNASDNVECLIQAAAGTGVHVLPGMELQSKEEVHLLCLFDTMSQCRQWQEEVSKRLPPLDNKEEIFGAQFVVNEAGEWMRTEGRLLSVSAKISLEEAVSGVQSLGGMVIPAHVDRPSFSLLSNLGMIPDSLNTMALEVTPRFVPRTGLQQWPQLQARCLIVNGDAHRLREMQARTRLTLAAPEIREIDLAFKGEMGRQVTVEWPDVDEEAL